MNQKVQSYITSDTLGKSVPELIIKVYDGAINNLSDASRFYQSEELTRGYDALEKAKRFIVHLYTTLDMEKGGEIADRLSKLYVFILEQINIAQATGNQNIMKESMVILKNIREGWSQLAEHTRKKPETPATLPGPPSGANLSFSI